MSLQSFMDVNESAQEAIVPPFHRGLRYLPPCITGTISLRQVCQGRRMWVSTDTEYAGYIDKMVA